MVIIKDLLCIREQFINHVSYPSCAIAEDDRLLKTAVSSANSQGKQVFFELGYRANIADIFLF